MGWVLLLDAREEAEQRFQLIQPQSDESALAERTASPFWARGFRQGAAWSGTLDASCSACLFTGHPPGILPRRQAVPAAMALLQRAGALRPGEAAAPFQASVAIVSVPVENSAGGLDQASRLLGSAAPGQLLVDPATYEALDDLRHLFTESAQDEPFFPASSHLFHSD